MSNHKNDDVIIEESKFLDAVISESLNEILNKSAFIRLPVILGDPNSNPPNIPIIPVKITTWYNGIKKGIYPKPVNIGERAVAWRTSDIKKLLHDIAEGKINFNRHN